MLQSPLSRVKFKGQPTPALPELPLAHSPPSTIDIDQTLLSSAAARDYQRHAISTSNRHCRSPQRGHNTSSLVP
ncbi:hypothetical protein ACHAWO_006771 [Cyclotella atomus]|uniref:Uncharacterized protein n=1 Tax=Cyclotella atomus TaxID=382360 RepID=A0ABD3NPK3_9STRA